VSALSPSTKSALFPLETKQTRTKRQPSEMPPSPPPPPLGVSPHAGSSPHRGAVAVAELELGRLHQRVQLYELLHVHAAVSVHVRHAKQVAHLLRRRRPIRATTAARSAATAAAAAAACCCCLASRVGEDAEHQSLEGGLAEVVGAVGCHLCGEPRLERDCGGRDSKVLRERLEER
jgi:hypothetical protein